MFEITKINESGYDAALAGLALSYGKKSVRPETVVKLAGQDGGHNKFLEQIATWWYIKAPRYWWQQAATYRMSSMQSESTMHTLMRQPITAEMFDGAIPIEIRRELEMMRLECDFDALKSMLPEGFLQARIWMLSYKTLRNIITQRREHRLPHWQQFCHGVMAQVDHPELLPGLEADHA